jgi:proline-specific peptidase
MSQPTRPAADPTVGTMPFRGGQTWYQVNGDPAGGNPPLLTLHGGPGSVHNYLLPLVGLLGQDRALVFYDQVGCGNSTRRPDWPPERWTVDLHLAELEALTGHLGLSRFHLLGHSWGGMLAAEYALRHPDRLASLILCSTAASSQRTIDSVSELRAELTADGTPGTPEYEQALAGLFVTQHICRVVPMPEELVYTLGQIAANPAVNLAMMGQDPDEVTGTLRGWTVEDRLAGLTVPTLVLGGEYDELNATARQPFLDLIPDVRGHVFAGASHVAFDETPAEFRDVTSAFLAAHDAG